MSLAQLKKKSTDISALQKSISEMKNKKSSSEDEYWKLTCDAAGNGTAELRFLPAHPDEDMPVVEVHEYFFGKLDKALGKKKWYINRSLETIGKKDPVKEEYWACINKKTEEHKEMAKEIRDRQSFIVWVYIVDDKNAPENNGRVMKTKLSSSQWKFITDRINPDEMLIEDGVVPIDVFNLWEGANFKLRAYNGSNNMRTYDRSVWMEPGPLFKDDEKMEEVYSKVTGLKSEVDPDGPLYKKTYAELEEQLISVLGRPLVKNEDEDEDDHVSALAEEVDESSVKSNKPSASEDDLEDAELKALLED